MSQRGPEGGAPSMTEEAETGSLGKLHEGLPEIGIHSFKDWDNRIIPKLEDKLRDGTQDLKYTCKDPLKTEESSCLRKLRKTHTICGRSCQS
jgi:hypothetical protein